MDHVQTFHVDAPVARVALAAVIALAVFALPLAWAGAAPDAPAIIPKPAKMEMKSGTFKLTDKTQITYFGEFALVDAEIQISKLSPEAKVKASQIRAEADKLLAQVRAEAEMLSSQLRPATGLPFPVKEWKLNGDLTRFINAITLNLIPAKNSSLGSEGYILECDENSIDITAATPAGLFYGGQTLRQLLPAAVFGSTLQKGVKWSAPCCAIEDQPRFGWRGFMLDYSRHVYTVEYTKHLLDAMALNKLNLFQMHLTDDEGWRVEIKKYPKLTEVGAWRGTECALPNRREENFTRYGGFFTQEQIREIVAYAAKLHINVMPEVDIPGHSLSITTAYPETKPGVAEGAPATKARINAISPAKEGNFEMVEGIIAEIAALFPFEYVHVGGDEVNFNLWKDSPEVKALIACEKLDGPAGAQVYFTKRLEAILAKHNKKMIGWNEILNEKLARGTAIMSWTGVEPGYEAVKMGFPVVMSPGPHCYFDMSYTAGKDEPPGHSWAGLIDTAKVYALDPLGEKGLDAAQSAKIFGVQANLWGEFITPWTSQSGWADFKSTGEHADFKAFPRLCALAEIGWTPQALRDFADFSKRLGPEHLMRMQNAGVNFRVPTPDAVLRRGAIVILAPYPGAEIRTTMDGSDPLTAKGAKTWNGKPLQGDAAGLRARTVFAGRMSPMVSGARYEPVGAWDKNSISAEFAAREFDVTAALYEPGTWTVALKRTAGRHGVAIKGVELLGGGMVIASDMHEGTTGAKGTYKLAVTGPLADKLTLRITMKEVNVTRGGKTEPLGTAGEVMLTR